VCVCVCVCRQSQSHQFACQLYFEYSDWIKSVLELDLIPVLNYLFRVHVGIHHQNEKKDKLTLNLTRHARDR
jgi:hypothetical protein